MPEKKIKKVLVQQMNINKADRILDFGCGTATLTIMAKQLHPGASFYGVDVDPKVLDIAREKSKGRVWQI